MIKLTNEQFDHFILSCENPKPVSPKIMAAARALGEEGFVLELKPKKPEELYPKISRSAGYVIGMDY